MAATGLDPTGVPGAPIQVRPPPELPVTEGTGAVLLNALPVLGSLGSIVLLAGIGGPNRERAWLAAGLMAFATLGFVLVQVERHRRQRARQVGGTRGQYLRYLADLRGVIRQAAAAQRDRRTRLHPAPAALPAVAAERSRIWERAPGDPEFLQVRFGTGRQRLELPLQPPTATPSEDVDPVSATALRRLLGVHGELDDLPVTVDLTSTTGVELCGADDRARAVARALLCSAAAGHRPDHLQMAVVAGGADLVHWDWLKWLPHAHSHSTTDAVGPRRLIAGSVAELTDLLPDLADPTRPSSGGPHLLLVLDGVLLPPEHPVARAGAGVTVVELPGRSAPLESAGRLRVHLGATQPDRTERWGEPAAEVRADTVDIATAEALGRRLIAMPALTSGQEGRGLAGPSDLLDLLGLGDVASFDPAWRARPPRERLRVPIGVGEDGTPVQLDLKESAQSGMGPHGLVVGATGSGKSEFLRTLVLGLALTHPPEQLNLVLVDFKGGATFAGLAELPHTSAVITNLAADLTLVDRMQDALSGELVRRQELLRAAGNLASIHDYEQARAAGSADRPALPSLLVVVDEFSELLSAKPEFLELFVALGRLGRSLGIHLLLASQRLDEGRLRGLDSHLSYRIGLRTFSAAESTAVLGVPDAYRLPGIPGLGYLRPDPATLLRFQAAYVSGPVVERRDTAPVPTAGILPFTIAEVRPWRSSGPEPPTRLRPGPPLLDRAVDRLRGRGTPAHRVWLPPLDQSQPLDRLLPDLTEVPGLGLVSPRWRAAGPLVAPVGIEDRPREQRHAYLTADLRGAGGHVAVVGGPRSGKSTLLRTVVSSLALTGTPLESQFYLLDLAGSLAPLAALPHVSGVGARSEPEVIRRIVAEVEGILAGREAYFREQAIDSIETYRSRRAAGTADDGYGEVFLVVDGWGSLRAEYDDLELRLQQLAPQALTFGVHLIVAAARWSDFRAAMRDVFGTRFELKLGDPLDSEVDRKLAQAVPAGRPGRGLTTGRHHFLAGLPRIDGDSDPGSLTDGTDELARRVTSAWRGPAGPKLRLLPHRVDLDALRAHAADPGRVWLAVDEAALAPVALDLDTEPHLLVFGDGGSGKTATLRSYLAEILRTRSASQAQFVVVDYRRGLLGEVPEPYLLHYLTNANQAVPAVRELAAYLENRIPGPEVTAEQLRNRGWWTGAEVFVIVDDYDLVAGQHSSPVQVLAPLLAQAREVGLHLVLARRSGGAGRALYEPVIQALRDLGTAGLLLSGSPEEGYLIGNHKPQPAVPGRGRLITREGAAVVQVAWTPSALD